MTIRPGLLALLASGPSHGYQLKTGFEAATGGMWKLNVGQVYTTLDRLGRDGCVVVDVHDDQKRYAITAAGREELESWWQALPGDEAPPRDELVMKVLLAIAAAPQAALAVVTGQRTALTEVLQRRRRAPRAEARGGADLVARLAADAAVGRAEGDLRWLDLCEARLLQLHRTTEPKAAREPGGTTVTTPALQVVDVVKRYGSAPTEVRALTDVSLTVAPGELVAVMGPSGCGKSTLLHLAGGLEPPPAGHVLVHGVDLEASRGRRWPAFAATRSATCSSA